MTILRAAGATLNQTPLDWSGNKARIEELLSQARSQEVDLLCLPELCLSGYGCEDMFLSPDVLKRAESLLVELLPLTRGMTVLFGLPMGFQGSVYNAAAMVQNERILGINLKKFLPRDGIHYETRWFRPWPLGVEVEHQYAGQVVRIGDLRYQLGEVGVAVEICEEAWALDRAAREHAKTGVQVVLNPSASHFALGKYTTRVRLVADASRAMNVHYVYSNLVGLEAGRILYDGGVLIAERGKIVCRGPRFGFRDGTLSTADLDTELATVNQHRARPEQSDDSLKVVQTPGVDGSSLSALRQANGWPALVAGPLQDENDPVVHNRFEEFCRAVSLGLFDYMRKSGSKGYVLSLSGGCDSSTVGLMVAQMISSAIAELGEDEFAKRVRIEAGSTQGSAAWVHRLLLCIYQRTAQSSEATEKAARDLATSIGAEYRAISVEALVETGLVLGQEILGRDLNWQDDDLALQNIQARMRAPVPWLLANVRGAILLTTSNRSEAAVGYATMDGDTAGGLAPLAGIDKRFLREFLRWAEENPAGALGAVRSLASVNCLEPTAELRPSADSESEQTDEADLMPYEILERIERLFVRDRKGASAMSQVIAGEFRLRPDVASGYVSKFLTLWRASQWKRERLAPSFHLDDENLDPRSWCRHPILSGKLDA